MKVEGYLFAFLAVFFGVATPIYWVYSKDPTGTGAMAFAALLGVLIGTYIIFTGRRIEPRPEDMPDANIEDGAGEIGFFSPHSWWPLPLGLGVGISAVSLVFGWWILGIGGVLLLVSLSGLLFEYYVTGQH